MDNYNKKKEYYNRIEYKNKYGKLHKLDGPAIKMKNGDKQWWINGLQHRVDGPASEFNNGYKEWWLYDKWVNENTHKIHSDSLFAVIYD